MKLRTRQQAHKPESSRGDPFNFAHIAELASKSLADLCGEPITRVREHAVEKGHHKHIVCGVVRKVQPHFSRVKRTT